MPDNFPKSNIPYSDWSKGAPYKKHDVVHLSNILDNVKFSEWTKDQINPNYKMLSLKDGVMFNNVSRPDFVTSQVTAEAASYDLGTITVTYYRDNASHDLLRTETNIEATEIKSGPLIGQEIKIINNSNWPLEIKRLYLVQNFWQTDKILSPTKNKDGPLNDPSDYHYDPHSNPNVDIIKSSAAAQTIPLYVFFNKDNIPGFNGISGINRRIEGTLTVELHQEFLQRLGFDHTVEIKIPVSARIVVQTKYIIQKKDTFQYILIQNFGGTDGDKLGASQNNTYGTPIAGPSAGWGFARYPEPLGTNIVDYLEQGTSAHHKYKGNMSSITLGTKDQNSAKGQAVFYEGKFLNQPNVTEGESQDFDNSDSFLAKNIKGIAERFLNSSIINDYQLNHPLNVSNDLAVLLDGQDNALDYIKLIDGSVPAAHKMPKDINGVPMWRENTTNTVLHPKYQRAIYHNTDSKFWWRTLDFNNVYFQNGFKDAFFDLRSQDSTVALRSWDGALTPIVEGSLPHVTWPTYYSLNSSQQESKWPALINLKGTFKNSPRRIGHMIIPTWQEYNQMNDTQKMRRGQFTPNLDAFFYNRTKQSKYQGRTIGIHHSAPLYYKDFGAMRQEFKYNGVDILGEYLIAYNFISTQTRNELNAYDGRVYLNHPCVAVSLSFKIL